MRSRKFYSISQLFLSLTAKIGIMAYPNNRLIGADHEPWLITDHQFIGQFSHVIHQPIPALFEHFYLLTMSVMPKASLRIFYASLRIFPHL